MRLFSGIYTHLLLTLVLIPLLSCCRKNAPQHAGSAEVHLQPTVVQLASPGSNAIFHCGDSVKIAFSANNTSIRLDSIALFDGKEHARSVTGNTSVFYWHSANSRVGQLTLRAVVYYNDSLHESHNVNIVLLSDVVPVKYTWRIVAKYPHDREAYTQGLVYDRGMLYESTGLEGKSSLRLVNIGTGKAEKMVSLASQYFGEGISIYKDEIYQITYKSQVGFVYDKNTLEQIRSFDYQISEGWGLTTDGKNLIMSDGSAQLFFLEPEFFTQVDKIQVFDNQGMIDSLNELEYVHGKILANVYGQTFIVIIDPLTGKVLGKAEFHDLMPEGSINDYGKVLNGIAFNPANGHLYITGKDWPVLYEIELTPSL